jgi:hypothetical protein
MSDERRTLRLLPGFDPTVSRIVQHCVPAFKTANFDEAMSAVVYLFALGISRCPPEIRENVVRDTVTPILTISASMAQVDTNSPPLQ